MSNNNTSVTKEIFIKKLLNLCLRSGLSGLPKDYANQNILLKSAALTVGESEVFTEQEINEKLKYWINEVSHLKSIDHVTLRRRLVDTGYLTRSNDGSRYRVSRSAPRPSYFEAAIEQIDISEEIKKGREEIARRKKEYIGNKL